MKKILSSQRFHVVCIVLTLCVLLSSCRITRIVETPVYVHDTISFTKEVHDSTYLDKWHYIYVSGDTVTRYDSIVVYRYKLKTDTAYKYVEKPVVVSKTDTVEVEKPLTWWQKLFIGVGVISLALCVSFVVLRIIKH